jgi:hypothetical protein
MKFQLVHKGDTAINAVFHITNARCDVVGGANIPRAEAAAFQKHWVGARAPGTPPAPPRPRGPALNLNPSRA